MDWEFDSSENKRERWSSVDEFAQHKKVLSNE